MTDDTMSRPAVHHIHIHAHASPNKLNRATIRYTLNDKYIREFIECALSYRFTCSASVDIKPIKLRNRASISWASSLSSPIQFHWLFVTDTKKTLSYRRAGYCATYSFMRMFYQFQNWHLEWKQSMHFFDKIWKVWINMRLVLIGSTSVSAREKKKRTL